MLDRFLFFLTLLSGVTSMTYVHDHIVHAALTSSQSSNLTPPTLPDAFRSFGSFSFIQTAETIKPTEESSTSKKIKKPIPKKLKCACEFQKVEAETNAVAASFLEKVVVPVKSSLLRSLH